MKMVKIVFLRNLDEGDKAGGDVLKSPGKASQPDSNENGGNTEDVDEGKPNQGKKTTDNVDHQEAPELEGKGGAKKILNEAKAQGLSPDAPKKYVDEEILSRIREMRTKVDSLFRTVKFVVTSSLSRPEGSARYLALAITAFESARHMLGKMLQERGSEDPNTNNDSKTITEKGEVLEEAMAIAEMKDLIILLRKTAEGSIVELDVFIGQYDQVSVKDAICTASAMQNLIHGRCWIGEVLDLIANESPVTA